MRRIVLLAAMALAACQPGSPPATPPARESARVTVGAIAVEDAVVRPPPGGVTTGAAYMTIRNAGDSPDRLLGARSPVASAIEMHTHRESGGVMRMERLEAVDVPARGAAVFQPGGLHLMLFGFSGGGDTVPVTLRFERAGDATVHFVVPSVAAAGDAHGH